MTLKLFRLFLPGELYDLVTRKLADVDAILTTETMQTMRTHSRHDLEDMIELGV